MRISGIAAVLALLASTIVLGCDLDPDSIGVPIEVTNADRVGAIAFNLIYDSSVLEAQDVDVKELARGATAQYSAKTPGKLVILLQNAPNIDGSGTLVEAKFKILNTGGSTKFQIEVLEALNLDTGESVETNVSDGSFSAVEGSVQPPTIVFG